MRQLQGILVTAVLMQFNVHAVTNSNPAEVVSESNNEESTLDLKKRLNDQEKNLKKLQSEVKDVEFNLVMNTKKYQKVMDERSKLNDRILEVRKNLDIESVGLKKNFRQTKSVLSGIVLHHLDKNENSSDLLSKKLLVQMLQKRLSDLSDLIANNQSLKKDLATLEANYEESMATEKEVIQIVKEMEERKSELAAMQREETSRQAQLEKKYADQKNKETIERVANAKKKLKERLQNVQLTEEIKVADTIGKAEVVSVISGMYGTPLKSFQDMSYDKKGITYNFNGKNEVRAPLKGTVVYTGALNNYGNVLMIDHGDETKSVLLGFFDYQLKKGDQVETGALIGYTKAISANPDSEGKLYYEVRKKNLVQNTYLLLDKRTLPKNFLR